MAKKLIGEQKKVGQKARAKYSNVADDGRFGKIAEVDIRASLNSHSGQFWIAGNAQADAIFHGHNIESKTGCGKLAYSAIKNTEAYELPDVYDFPECALLPHCRFVVYMIEADNTTDFINIARVLPRKEFLDLFRNAGLFRWKPTSTEGTWDITIQSFKNSKKKLGYIMGGLAQYPTLAEWLTSHK